VTKFRTPVRSSVRGCVGGFWEVEGLISTAGRDVPAALWFSCRDGHTVARPMELLSRHDIRPERLLECRLAVEPPPCLRALASKRVRIAELQEIRNHP